MSHRLLVTSIFALICLLTPPSAGRADTLADVRARGTINCGIHEVPGFATRSESGVWSGFWIEMCRAVAAAVLGNADRVTINSADILLPFEALAHGEVDLLAEGTTWTLSRESDRGVDFPVVYYYDGQAFLATKSSGITAMEELGGARICVTAGTTTHRNLANFLSARNLLSEVTALESHGKVWESFTKGRCDVITHDLVILKVMLATQFANPADYLILPGTISREPTGPVVDGDDRAWSQIVRWSILAMIAAEELGVTSSNIDTFTGTGDSQIIALTGQGEDHAATLGIEPGWMRRIVSQVGNYGEVFDRSLTKTLGLQRGQNALWRDGGYLYAPPLY